MIIGYNDALFFPGDADWAIAQTSLGEAGFGDGLPLVVPTRKRLDDMLAGIQHADRSLGEMPPLQGALTIEAVAYCCVLAGCTPRELPVVVAAATATLDPGFNLLGIQTTTGTPTVCVAVHGPIVLELGMNSETNCLGPGNRSNACIGRALQLVLWNIGGALPGLTDMATMGQPGKYVFCFAEGASSPLLPPLPSRRGLAADASAVTVMGVSGTLEVLPRHPANSAECIALAIIDAMHGSRVPHDAGETRECHEQFILIPPEMADLVQASRWDLAALQDFIFRKSPANHVGSAWPLAHSAKDIHVIGTGGVGTKMTCLVPWGVGTASVTRPILSLGP